MLAIFLINFCASHRTNYATEVFTLVTREMFLLSPRMAFQLKWRHTINTHGRVGRNIPIDIHMEHLNRECKNALSALESNMTAKHVGKYIGKVVSILHRFDQANAIPYQSRYPPHHSLSEDIKKIVQLLTTSSVSTVQEGCYHCTF